MVAEHLPGYQARDEEVVDYQMYALGDTELSFRGPPPVGMGVNDYFTCLGAAQTFGCFCQDPFPKLLAEQVGVASLNLGYGGAGPYFYRKHPALLPYINDSRFAVVQVMSGRSESNSVFDSGGLEYLTRRRDGRKFAAADAWRSVLEGNYYWNKLPLGKTLARRVCQAFGRKRAQRLVAETRERWITNYNELLSEIKVPKILLWFSVRSPDYVDDYSDVHRMFADFPQLVNRQMIDAIRPRCDEYVECVSSRGLPQPLVSRHTGTPCTVDLSKDRNDFAGIVWTHNPYYPSPEMQQDATEQLLTSTVVRETCQLADA